MLSRSLRHLLPAAFVLLSAVTFAQDNMSGAFKRSLYDADELFNDGNYLRALAMYDSLWDLRPNDVYL